MRPVRPSLRKKGNKLLVKLISDSKAAEDLGMFFTEETYYQENYSSVNYFKNGKFDGLREVYNNKELIMSENRRNGLLDGEKCTYGHCYKDTLHYKKQKKYCIQSKANYKNGLLDGLFVLNNSYGNISEQMNYSNGLLNGKYTSYHDNGSIEISANYYNDTLEGKYYSYDDKGRLLKDFNFKKGKPDNVNYFYESFSPLPTCEIHCKSGYLLGNSYEFFGNTKLVKKKVECDKSDSASFRFYDENVRRYESDYRDMPDCYDEGNYNTSSLPDYSGKVTWYYKNGAKSLEELRWKYRSDTLGKTIQRSVHTGIMIISRAIYGSSGMCRATL